MDEWKKTHGNLLFFFGWLVFFSNSHKALQFQLQSDCAACVALYRLPQCLQHRILQIKKFENRKNLHVFLLIEEMH